MRERTRDAGRKVVAFAVLMLAVWLLFKLVIGVVATIAWIAVGLFAIIAVIWALRVL